jgi:hypothetical protein
MGDMKNAFVEEQQAIEMTKHKRGKDSDMQPNETPSQWIKRIKEINYE